MIEYVQILCGLEAKPWGGFGFFASKTKVAKEVWRRRWLNLDKKELCKKLSSEALYKGFTKKLGERSS